MARRSGSPATISKGAPAHSRASTWEGPAAWPSTSRSTRTMRALQMVTAVLEPACPNRTVDPSRSKAKSLSSLQGL